MNPSQLINPKGLNRLFAPSLFKMRHPLLSSVFDKLAVAILYVLAYWLLDGFSFIYLSDRLGITPWNPPVAAGVILLLARGFFWSPMLFVAALSYQVFFEKPDAPLSVMVATSASEALIYVCAVWLLVKKFKIDRHLTNLRDVIVFAVTIIAATGCMGVSYILAYYSAGIISAHDAPPLIAQYWVGDCVGVLVLTPFFLVNWPAIKKMSWRTRFAREAVVQTLFTILLVFFAFWMDKNNIHMFYIFFVPLVWGAISKGVARVTWIILVIQLVGVFSSWEFETTASMTLKFLPFIMTVISCMGLILGAVIDEKERVKLSNLKNDARLKAILDMTPDGMMIIDMQGHIVAANKNFMRLFGTPKSQLDTNHPVRNIIPTFYPEINGETFLLNAEGSDVPIEISSTKVSVGDKYSTILTLRDISSRKQAEIQMRQRRAVTEQTTRANLTGGLAAVLAHELNQPLSAIMSYTSACSNIIAGMEAPPPRVTEQLAKISVQARRAGDIIRRLREFFQNSSVEIARVDVRELISETIMLLEDELTQTHVDIEVSIGEPLTAAIDRIQIEQVLINLIRNSIEALKNLAKDKKKIRISATPSLRGDIEIVVTDTGAGIAPEIADQLFNPFVTTRLSGMGLGLTISRSIVEAHNGRLWAELQSAAGASMHFTIPAFNKGLSDAT